MTRISSAFNLLKRVGFAFLVLATSASPATAGLDEWTQEAPLESMDDAWLGWWEGRALWQTATLPSTGGPVRLSLDSNTLFDYELYDDTWYPGLIGGIFQHPYDWDRIFRAQVITGLGGRDTLFYTLDQGETWIPLFRDDSLKLPCDMLWNPEFPENGYFLSRGRGIWVTGNRGQSWEELELEVDLTRLRCWSHPAAGHTFCYVLSSTAAPHYRVHAFDMNTRTTEQLWTTDSIITRVETDRSDPTRIILAQGVNFQNQSVASRLWHSTDGGESFDILWETPDSAREVKQIEQDLVNPMRWLTRLGLNSDLYESVDGGYTWTRTARDIGEFVLMDNTEGELLSLWPYHNYRPSATDTFRYVAIGPPDRGYAVMQNLFYTLETGLQVIFSNGSIARSFDGGFNWKPWGFVPNDLLTVRDVGEVSPANHNVAIATEDNTFGYSLDGGENWARREVGPPDNYTYGNSLGIAWHPTDPNTLIKWRYRPQVDSIQVMKTTNLGETWQNTYGYIWPGSFMLAGMVYYSAEPETLLIGGTPGWDEDQLGGLWYSVDGGATWILVPGMETEWGGPMFVDMENRRLIKYSPSYDGLIRNDMNSISDWYPIQGDLPIDVGLSFAVDPDSAETMYVWASGDAIYKGQGDGNWERYIETPGWPRRDLVVLPGWPKSFLFAGGAGLWEYTKSRPLNVTERAYLSANIESDILIAPNPANGDVSIRWDLPVSQGRKLSVFNTLGQHVSDIDIPDLQRSGVLTWNPSSKDGNSLASGVYFVGSKEVGKFVKFLLIR